MNNFILRTITAVVFVILIIGSVLISHWAFSALFLIVTIGGYLEYTTVVRKLNIYPSRLVGSLLALGTYGVITMVAFNVFSHNAYYFLLLVPVIICTNELFRNKGSAINNVASALLGIVWIVVPLALLSGFFNLAEEMKWRETGLLLGFFLILWIYDSGAYIFGSMFGKHKMIERISPKKTWEGFAGGAMAGLLTAWLISASFTEFNLYEWLLTAVLIIIAGTAGDLAESMFKRNAGIKDSGRLLPGHGGILDRFDAVFLAAPVVYILIRLVRFIN